ncbi:hypothetical protein EGR_06102 [Echinococcus granulosus]|uniref:TFIIS N-terminal domain-containing protein n=2 Tax=Echinococcus granulosus TaxID=6210 RepID=W6UCU2_ECHGR|nr:hypothetical protein EGR_06102 [Echinococcus granulosus]EUB59110.1 hypothetical protein EGR_06102 [Echinococcus granulosus]
MWSIESILCKNEEHPERIKYFIGPCYNLKHKVLSALCKFRLSYSSMAVNRETYEPEEGKLPIELDDSSFDLIADAKTLPGGGFDAVGSDNEYRVEPFMSPTTPTYTPSRLAMSNSDSEISSSSPECQTHEEKRMRVDLQAFAKGSALSPETFERNKERVFSSGDEEERNERSDLEENEKAKEEKADADFEGFDGDEEGAKGMIADIFGESDAEEEGDFEGFAENEVEKEAAVSSAASIAAVEIIKDEVHHHHQPREQATSDNDDDDEGEGFISDFDRFMSRRREETRRRRRLGRDEEFLNDNDEIIRETVSKMKSAADEDRRLLSKNRPATKKLSMLNVVSNLLIRAGMKPALIDNGILGAITEWLSPVSGHVLPSVTIRETLLRHLSEFHIQDPDLLRDSGIGKAVMYLYKHPRETRANKMLAGHLINEWSRPIFNLTSDYGSLTREERKQLDLEHLPKRRNLRKEGVDNIDVNQKSSDNQIPLRPGDPGWVNRARVPQPSNKDYVIRPKWNVPTNSSTFEEGDTDDVYDNEEGRERDGARSARKRRLQQAQPPGGASSRIERHIRALAKNAAVRRKTRFVRAVPMSVEGRNMSL